MRGLAPIILIFIVACSQEAREVPEQPVYEGPMREVTNVNTLYSDSAIVKIRIIAPRQLFLLSGDEEYPEGVFLEFYDELGNITSVFQSDKAFYRSEEKHYQGIGNVIVKNLESGDELNTEELFWKPEDKRVYTNKFVTILSEGEVHTGEGLIANQNFDNYQILKPTGTLSIQDGR